MCRLFNYGVGIHLVQRDDARRAPDVNPDGSGGGRRRRVVPELGETAVGGLSFCDRIDLDRKKR